jgi:Protein of unknown function (DUF4236)
MGWRFRQSFTIIPGLRLNLSSSGLSASIGGSPFTLNVGPHGVQGTVSIPGAGLSYRHRFSDPSAIPQPPMPDLLPEHRSPTHFVNTAPIETVHSASTELLTSVTLKELKQFICTAEQQHADITRELDSARTAKVECETKYLSWRDGVLLKRLFKTAFAKRKEQFETESARVAELEEQQKLSTISACIDVENEQAELYYRFRDEFAALCECAAIWDIKAHQRADKFHERTMADMRIDRELVRFELGGSDLIQWEQKVPHLRNAKGGDLYLYPGFILYRAAREAFSLIEYHDIIWDGSNSNFIEDGKLPEDCKVLGSTWVKANKDGSRDRRFVENYQIPTVQYGQIVLKSDQGLWEEFMFSNFGKMANWLNALKAFGASFPAIAK